MNKSKILALGLSMLSLVSLAGPASAAPGWFGFGGNNNRYQQQAHYNYNNNGYRPNVFNRAAAQRRFDYERMAHNQYSHRGNPWFGQRRSRW
jgi:hypothetical protein